MTVQDGQSPAMRPGKSSPRHLAEPLNPRANLGRTHRKRLVGRGFSDSGRVWDGLLGLGVGCRLGMGCGPGAGIHKPGD